MEHTIKRCLYSVIFMLMLTFQFVSAQLETSIDTDSIHTVLFKVTSSDNGHVSYLFGTHHAFGKVFFDGLQEANQALASCDLLIKENLNIPGEMAEDIINRRTAYTKWKQYLNKEDLKYIEQLFAASPTDYNKMSPTEMYVFLNRHFKQQVCLAKGDDDSSLSLDDYISSKASEQNIDLLGLETTAEQIALINKDVEGLPKRNHKRRLANIIANIRSENSASCEETDWYVNMQMDYKYDEPCRNALVLTDRNNKWMIEIKEKLETNNCFIAVGLSHLMFECGLINQIKSLGYTITPIEIN